jgi:hypothetical protein
VGWDSRSFAEDLSRTLEGKMMWWEGIFGKVD